MQKKAKKLLAKLQQTQKTIKLFITNYFKNYQSMKKKLAKIWLVMCAVTIAAVTITSCNVTRKVTTESSYYQRGDTTCTIVTKTIESYDATKKGM